VTQGPIAVLANPHAGRGRHRAVLPLVLERLRAGGADVRLLDAPSRDGALDAARQAVGDGIGALVAAGGDGTVHLAFQAVAGTDTPLGVIPAGTGNDFAVETGLPRDPLAAADAILAGESRRVDLARLDNGLWFGAVFGAGFDAIVNERANRMRFPRGPRRYDLAIFAEMMRLRPRHYKMRLDGVVEEFEAVLVAVGNTASYGGGMRICPDADPTDGLLDVVIGLVDRRTLVRIKPKVYAGRHVDHPGVRVARARTVELHADSITGYADGERAVPLPVTITAVPGALRLLGASGLTRG